MDKRLTAVFIAAIVIAAGAGVAVYAMMDKGTVKDIDVNLEIYGNADKDGRISMDDAVLIEQYVEAVEKGDTAAISSVKERMSLTFADANLDGRIDKEDAAQVRGIVNKTAESIWLLDGIGKDRRISTDISRIGCEYFSNVELCLILGQADKIAAVDNAPYQCRDFYFTQSQLGNITNMVNCSAPDYDLINSLDLDTYLMFASTASYEAKQEKIIGCDVIYLGLYNPDITNTEKSNYVQGVLKAGYIFGVADRAESYINWLLGYRDGMMQVANSIPEESKPVVAMSNYTSGQYFMDDSSNVISLYRSNDPLGQAISLAGGANVLDKLSGSSFITNGSYAVTVQIDAVFNDDKNIHVDNFFLHMVKYTYGGLVNTGVPEQGYGADDYAEIKDAYAVAKDHSLITDEQIALIAGDFRNGCTGGILLAAYVGSVINHDLYQAFDPVKIHNEYVGWMGISDYDVSKNGVFMYPSVAA